MAENQRDIGPAVAQFAENMRRKLRQNEHKGSWLGVRPEHYVMRIMDEVDELQTALALGDPKAIIDECADIANFAMFIADGLERRSSTPVEQIIGAPDPPAALDPQSNGRVEELHVAKCDLGDCEWESDPLRFLSHAQDELAAHQYGHRAVKKRIAPDAPSEV